MNWIDILIVIPLAYAAWKGFRKGLVIELFSLLALLVGIYAGINFSDWTSELIQDQFGFEGRYLPVVAFTLTFLGVAILVYFLGKLIEGMLKMVQLSLVNKLLGLLFGTVKVLYILSIVLVLVETYDERGNFISDEVKDASLLYHPVIKTSMVTIPAVEQSIIWIKNTNEDFVFPMDEIKEVLGQE